MGQRGTKEFSQIRYCTISTVSSRILKICWPRWPINFLLNSSDLKRGFFCGCYALLNLRSKWYSTLHSCWNLEKIRQWAQDHQLDGELITTVHVEGWSRVYVYSTKASTVKYHELRTYLLTMFGLKTNIDRTYLHLDTTYRCVPRGSYVVTFTMGTLSQITVRFLRLEG